MAVAASTALLCAAVASQPLHVEPIGDQPSGRESCRRGHERARAGIGELCRAVANASAALGAAANGTLLPDARAACDTLLASSASASDAAEDNGPVLAGVAAGSGILVAGLCIYGVIAPLTRKLCCPRS